MKALVLAAAFAVACSGFASATEVKKDTPKAPAQVAASKAMTDKDMDKVTAGNGAGTIFLSTPAPLSGVSPGRGQVCMNCN